jgi:TRAP-type C4-dicarboxylate transport system permease small subunit
MNTFFKIVDFVDLQISKLEAIMLSFSVIAMAVNTITGVISRFVFNDAIVSTDELNMIFIVFVTFSGLSYAARNGRHIRMSAIYDMFDIKRRKIFIIIISFITSIFMFLLSYYSAVYIMDLYNSGRILPALDIPVFYIYLWVPLGFLITALQYSFTVLKNFREKDVYLSTKVTDKYCEINETI